MKNKLINKDLSSCLKTRIAHLAQNNTSSHRSTSSDTKKHCILRNISNNKNKPDKGNGVVIMGRNVYYDCRLNIINHQSKFKLLNKDPTLNRGKQTLTVSCVISDVQVLCVFIPS